MREENAINIEDETSDDNDNVVRKLKGIASVATIGGLLFGFDTGVINGAISYMASPKELNLSPSNEGLVTSSVTLGAAFGAIVSGHLSDKAGRKRLIIILAILFFFGTLGCSIAPNVISIIFFRIIVGLGVGGASVVVPTYLSEIATTDLRGQLVTQNEFMIVTGQLLAFVVNALFANFVNVPHIWRYMLGFGMIPATALFIGMQFLPESPRWLVLKGRDEEALKILSTIRRDESDGRRELRTVHSIMNKNTEKIKPVKELRKPWIRRLVVIGAGLGIMQQFIGVNIMMYYGTSILNQAGFTKSSSMIANIGNGIVAVIATIVSMHLITQLNRRKYMLTGIAGTTVSLITLVILSHVLNSAMLPYGVIICLMTFMAFFQGAISPLVWVLLSEIFPQHIRGLGMGAATFFLWISNFVVGYVFPIMNSTMGPSLTFIIFAIFNVIAWFFAYKCVPETRGLTLEEIQQKFINE
ncbi:sugar transport protein [Companilactobacillus tucceti DSM 20183]|uniref:Sugar transport protein n=1 Tax=Companilactobacillus tucceti DSM 20183 TaxID=1423811 RepID=A0A0R1J0Q7_9LACO|nr:sugar porter family MFS transporter [Companilactobacillus tucceti]KRK64651.1 sugar transport protein [Companilactobacillus tucceti DSM 20183]